MNEQHEGHEEEQETSPQPTPPRKPKKAQREPSQQETARYIAEQLGETAKGPRAQLLTTVRALGRTQSHALLEETLRIEASGGMLTADGSRRRTPGGVFFHLVLTKGVPKRGKKLRSKKKRQTAKRQSQQQKGES